MSARDVSPSLCWRRTPSTIHDASARARAGEGSCRWRSTRRISRLWDGGFRDSRWQARHRASAMGGRTLLTDGTRREGGRFRSITDSRTPRRSVEALAELHEPAGDGVAVTVHLVGGQVQQRPLPGQRASDAPEIASEPDGVEQGVAWRHIGPRLEIDVAQPVEGRLAEVAAGPVGDLVERHVERRERM